MLSSIFSVYTQAQTYTQTQVCPRTAISLLINIKLCGGKFIFGGGGSGGGGGGVCVWGGVCLIELLWVIHLSLLVFFAGIIEGKGHHTICADTLRPPKMYRSLNLIVREWVEYSLLSYKEE